MPGRVFKNKMSKYQLLVQRNTKLYLVNAARSSNNKTPYQVKR